MIDQSDIANALVAQIVSAVYPNGTSAPSVSGATIRVFHGWPQPTQLQADCATGIAQISVYPLRTERVTSGLMGDWQTVSTNAPTLSVSLSGNTVTIGGSVSTPQNVMIAVNGKPYSYGVQSVDTLATIASSLASLIAADTPASSSGAVVTVSGNPRIKAGIGVQGLAAREVRRQAKQFQLSVWAPSPTVRDTIAASVDVALAKAPHLALQYGFAGRLAYKGSHQDDADQKSGIYRRDTMFEVEYPTVESENETAILGIAENLAPQISGVTLTTGTVWST